MKEGWKVQTLGTICDFQNGFAFKSNSFCETGVGVVRISDIQNGEVSTEKMTYVDPHKINDDLSNFKVRPNDILIAMSGGTTGKLGINKTGKEFFQNQRVGLFREHKDKLNHLYLYYFLQTKTEESLRIAAGAAQPNLSTSQIKGFEIPVPPLSEQDRIVKKLDEAFAKIDGLKQNAEKGLQAVKDLWQASVNNIFSKFNNNTKLSELAKISSGFAFKSNLFEKEGKYQILRIGNVKQGKILLKSSPIFINKIDSVDLKKAELLINDLVITQTGTKNKRDYGFVSLIQKENLLLNQRVARVRVTDSNFTPKFFLYFSYTESFKSQYFANEGGAVGQGNVGISALTDMLVPYPNPEIQKEVVNTLDRINLICQEIQTNYDQELTEYEALKQSILRKAFSGEL